MAGNLSFERKREAAIYADHWEQYDREFWRDHRSTPDELEAVKLRRILRPVDPWTSDADLCNLAKDRAGLMLDWVIDLGGPVTLEAINAKLESLEAKPMEFHKRQTVEVQIQAAVKRIGCEYYWRRQLRRAQVRKREAQEQAAGRICARVMPYCHDATEARYTQRQHANRAMLEDTEIESADGEIITLWAAVEASTANKSIRRGELMTRIRGCEEWATAAGMVGIFTTNTLPSRFHASLFGGGKNPNYDGSTPRDGQGWLSKTWARARAKIQRAGLPMFGFRVGEPHHDGCPHWHMLLWTTKENVQLLQDILRVYWLQEEFEEARRQQKKWSCMGSGKRADGQPLFVNQRLFFGGLNLEAIERGCTEYRFKAEAIDPARGGAVAYVAKYIAKNIDDFGDVGTEGHYDQQGAQREMIEGGNKARRVTAWASAWGIRQFQAIGQPPVTVWRELRRVDAGMVIGASKRLQRAHAAVHKGEAHRADWCAYLTEQGGAMAGRAYQLRLEFDTEEKTGRYGPIEVDIPKGVIDVAHPGELCASSRKKWKPKGTWTPAERHTAKVGTWGELAFMAVLDPTWTRFNNCTQAAPEKRKKQVNSYAFLTQAWAKPEPRRISRRQNEGIT
jgi:hypothetical protein